MERKNGRITRESLKVAGDELLKNVREYIRQGNIRRIVIKNDEERVLLEIPLTVGIVGTLLLPVWAALGALAAVASGFTIEVERAVKPSKPIVKAARRRHAAAHA